MYLFHRYNPLDVYECLMIQLHSPGVFLHPHLSVWEIQIWKCYHFSLSTIDHFELKHYFVTIICQIVSWYCFFKRPEFHILIKIMDKIFPKNISQIWKLLGKLKNSILFSLVAIYTPSPIFKHAVFSNSLLMMNMLYSPFLTNYCYKIIL